MTKWKRWRRETSQHYRREPLQAMLAYLRAREEAQAPRHPIHLMLFMRWAYCGTAVTSLRDDKARHRGIYFVTHPPPEGQETRH